MADLASKIVELEGWLTRLTRVLEEAPPMRSIEDQRFQSWALRAREVLQALEDAGR